MRDGLRDISDIADRLENLGDMLPPRTNRKALESLYNANNELKIAINILGYEFDNLDSKRWHRSMNRKAKSSVLNKLTNYVQKTFQTKYKDDKKFNLNDEVKNVRWADKKQDYWARYNRPINEKMNRRR